MPDPKHESCDKRLGDLAERLGKLELQLAAVNLEVLDKAEKVAERLKDRERKREQVPIEPERKPRPWELGRRDGLPTR